MSFSSPGKELNGITRSLFTVSCRRFSLYHDHGISTTNDTALLPISSKPIPDAQHQTLLQSYYLFRPSILHNFFVLLKQRHVVQVQMLHVSSLNRNLLPTSHSWTHENLFSTNLRTHRIAQNLLQQRLAESIEDETVKSLGLCRIVGLKFCPFCEQKNETGSSNMQPLSVHMPHPQVFSIAPTLIWRLQQRQHICIFRHQEIEPHVAAVRRA